MNKARLESTRNYFEAQDSYSIANVLHQARAKSKPFGLPLSISLTKIQGQCPDNLERKVSPAPARSEIPPDVEAALPAHSNNTSSASCASLMRSTTQRLRSRLKGLIWQEVEANVALSPDEGLSKNPGVKSYGLSLEGGLQLGVLEIDICIKQSRWNKFAHDIRICDGSGFKSIVLSEKGASLIQMLQNDIKIILLSGAGASLTECYDKIISDISLAESQVRQETSEGWHPRILHRLHHVMRVCKELKSNASCSSDERKMTSTLNTRSAFPLVHVASSEATVISFDPIDANNNCNAVRTYCSKSFEVAVSVRPSEMNIIQRNNLDINEKLDNCYPKKTASRLLGEVLTKFTSFSLWLKKACGAGQIAPFNIHPPVSSTDASSLRRIFSNSNIAYGMQKLGPSCYPNQGLILAPTHESITYKPTTVVNLKDNSSLEENLRQGSQIHPVEMESIKAEIFPP